jgi:hypothetical protein
VPSIEKKTGLVPGIIARCVWQEAATWLAVELPGSWAEDLVTWAEAVFTYSPGFRRSILRGGPRARDCLWAFMRHWFYAIIAQHDRELAAHLPSEYAWGADLPPRPPSQMRARPESRAA